MSVHYDLDTGRLIPTYDLYDYDPPDYDVQVQVEQDYFYDEIENSFFKMVDSYGLDRGLIDSNKLDDEINRILKDYDQDDDFTHLNASILFDRIFQDVEEWTDIYFYVDWLKGEFYDVWPDQLFEMDIEENQTLHPLTSLCFFRTLFSRTGTGK